MDLEILSPLSQSPLFQSSQSPLSQIERFSCQTKDEFDIKETGVSWNQRQYEGKDLVIVPSLTFDGVSVKGIKGVECYEERSLCFLFYLKYTGTRVIFPSSSGIDPRRIEYFLKLLPNYDEEMEKRLLMLSVDSKRKQFDPISELDSEKSVPEPLTNKLLTHWPFIATMKEFLGTADISEGTKEDTALIPFMSTPLEQRLANLLNVSFRGSPPDLARWGNKKESRMIFHEANVPHCYGNYELLYKKEEIVDCILDLWMKDHSLQQVVVKHNQGVSGLGNAILTLPKNLESLSPPEQKEAVLANLEAVHPECCLPKGAADLKYETRCDGCLVVSKGTTREIYFEFAERYGVIVEKLITHSHITSPSAQGLIDSEGQVRLMSTHEQVLDGQVYKGCINPARAAYRKALLAYSMDIGKALAAKGCRDRFAVDFITWPTRKYKEESTFGSKLQSDEVIIDDEWEWEIHAIEINLRHGATTAPATICDLLCESSLSLTSGLMETSNGKAKYYIASDNMEGETWRGRITPKHLLDQIRDNRQPFVWNQQTKTGTIFHLLGCLYDHGKVGVTCIGDSIPEAEKMFANVKASLDELAASISISVDE